MKKLVNNNMSGLLISIFGIAVGIIVTVLVSRHFFKRSLKKSLTPYIQFHSSPLTRIDPKVREQLEVKYQGQIIDNLHEIQFLVANTGDSSIRDIIEPLTLDIPEGSSVLDATILYINPKGRSIKLQLSKDKKKVIFEIPLLNSGDFFITKILLNGSPRTDDFTFSISAEYLPPTLTATHLPVNAIQTSKTRKGNVEYIPFLIGLGILFFGLAVIPLIVNEWSSFPDFVQFGFWGFFKNLGLTGWSMIVSILSSATLIIFGGLFVILSFSDVMPKSHKCKFLLPDDSPELVRSNYGFPFELMEINRNSKNKTKTKDEK
jgi:hypothetical protein